MFQLTSFLLLTILKFALRLFSLCRCLTHLFIFSFCPPILFYTTFLKCCQILIKIIIIGLTAGVDDWCCCLLQLHTRKPPMQILCYGQKVQLGNSDNFTILLLSALLQGSEKPKSGLTSVTSGASPNMGHHHSNTVMAKRPDSVFKPHSGWLTSGGKELSATYNCKIDKLTRQLPVSV